MSFARSLLHASRPATKTLLNAASVHSAFSCALASITSPFLYTVSKRFAHKKTGGSTQNKSPRQPKYRRFRMKDGSYVKRGQMIATQTGQKWRPSYNTGMGRDYTIYALRNGWVRAYKDPKLGKSFIMVAQDFDANDYQITHGLPLKRFPHSQITRMPKVRNFQIKYTLDRRNLGPKSRFRVNYPAPVDEPERWTLTKPAIEALPYEKLRYIKSQFDKTLKNRTDR
eukprot:CAMPEP_0117439008 /NCGR_PEP_ID=MMETSP0759-20121206/2348_1 /TAXON_ID=63605 /ORGANISM="Percolomonas cosmopolitus, Strain WS" /LENGTH=225 /DNA_ID=CAMNT_0005230719 /DNA_START=10 /DNA_END=687 /DNA_ORIENTATION=-